MIYLLLAFEFFKIGLFSFGGGYATLPFLFSLAETQVWYTVKDLSHMIAVASITPGPVGINVATYAGLKTAGIFGSIIATVCEVLPSFIIVIIAAKLLKKYSENLYVKYLLETLKPISCALLTSVAVGLLKPELNDIKAMILLAILLLISWKSKKDTLFYILIAGITGICLNLFRIF